MAMEATNEDAHHALMSEERDRQIDRDKGEGSCQHVFPLSLSPSMFLSFLPLNCHPLMEVVATMATVKQHCIT